MPKEKVYNTYFGQFARALVCDKDHDHSPDCWKTGDPLDDSYLHVGWMKEHAQVELAILKESDDEIDNDRWHAQFDRGGINRMIRLLRKARDDAFGKDQ